MDLNRVAAIMLKELTAKQKGHAKKIRGAILSKDHDQLKKLLSIADKNVINNNNIDESMLDIAVNLGDYVASQILLAYGAIPDYKRPIHVWPMSTLARAIFGGNYKIIQLLINYGCNPDTTLEIASEQVVLDTIPHNYWYKILELESLPIFKYLLECKGRRIGNDIWSQKMLFAACSLPSISIVKYLLDEGVHIESTDEKNWTSLFYAVAYRNIDVFHLLIARGANLNHMDFEGRSLLHIPIFYHMVVSSSRLSPKVFVALVISKGADVDVTDNAGLTPINAALTIKNINDEIILLLLSRRCIDLSKPDKNGITVLHRVLDTDFCTPIRRRDGNINAMMPLKNLLSRLHEEDINAQDRYGRSALHYINFNNMEHLGVLLEFGADTKILRHLKQYIYKDKYFLRILGRYQIKRTAADLSKDLCIDKLLTQYGGFWEKEHDEYVPIYSEEVQQMKKTILYNELTFYDFLHTKKRACMKFVKRRKMRRRFVEFKSNFKNYENMLTKKYIYGTQPLTPNELQAITSAEKNLNVIFKSQLPNSILNNIKKYLDIEDLIIVKNIKRFFE